MVILALNYLEGTLRFDQMHLLGRRPNAIQRLTLRRLGALVAMCDSPAHAVLPMVPGRSGPEFIARLRELEHFAERSGLLDPKSYSAGPLNFEKTSVGRIEQVDQETLQPTTQPYTSLNAERIKIVDGGGWRVDEHIGEEFWLPYVEPKILQHGLPIDFSAGPNLKRENRDEYLRLAKIWSEKGLLFLTAEKPRDEAFSRVFNARKSEAHDRQIGDRRLMNAAECSILGPSRFLPAGYLLTSLAIPKGHFAAGAITDRKDFYHQCWTSIERASSNITPFAFLPEELGDLPALLEHQDRLKQKRTRSQHGDRLGMGPRPILSGDEPLYPCFKAIFQGDHLGVEFALLGHASLLQSYGLLVEDGRVMGNSPFPLTSTIEGLVIDDYFSISVVKESTETQAVASTKNFRFADAAYAENKVMGSPEKDVVGSRHFKVVGAEIDSSKRALSLGLSTISAPLDKRAVVSALALRAARLPIITSPLAARLAGNFTSIFMYRRCLACTLAQIYGISSAEDNGSARPAVYELPRRTADELVLAAVLAFVAVSDASAPLSSTVFATDASLSKGAITSRKVPPEVAKVLWLGGDKKGAYTMLDPPFKEACRYLGEAEEEFEPPLVKPKKSPDFAFDFVEVCAGAGSVSKAMAKLGHTVCTPIELSDSKFFDVTDLRLIEWIFHMLKTGRFLSIMVEPVCTTFSPAAHPAVRSYALPEGFDRLDPKTHLGNVIAFRCLALIWYAAKFARPALAEQPRLSKMAWMAVWRYLVEHQFFEEAVVASCQFGSPHGKEFRMLGWGIDMEAMERKCPGGHDHIRIEGKFTKPSAMYVSALAEHFASCISTALRVKRAEREDEPVCQGLESVLINDLLMTGKWTVQSSWFWRKASHINLLESHAGLALMKKLTCEGGDIRYSSLLDSRVAKGSFAKGRSSARALTPLLKKAASWQICGGLYPAYGFAPTRLNTADAPTRDRDLPDAADLSLADVLPVKRLQQIHARGFSRGTAMWVRIVLLLTLFGSSEAAGGESWTYHFGFLWIFTLVLLLITCISAFRLAQHLTAPLSVKTAASWIFMWTSLSICTWIFTWTFPPPMSQPIPLAFGFGNYYTGVTIGISNLPDLLVIGVSMSLARSHDPQPLPLAVYALPTCVAMPLEPVGHEENRRADRRSSTRLVADRVLRAQTRDRREMLLNQFESWLIEHYQISITQLLDNRDADAETVSDLLVAYGKELFYAGKPYGRYSETINAVATRRPILKRYLVGAWDLAYAWVADEPATHHPAMPLTVVLAFSALALLWGWPREAALLLLTWSGILRIGETLAARRRDLILPRDGAPGTKHALLQVYLPKTRGTAARHQSARIDPADVVQLLDAVFRYLEPEQKLWTGSPGTLRRRFGDLQKALGLPTMRSGNVVPYDMASLRGGGATFLLQRFEDAELVRRRGRWLSGRIMECYLQEIAVTTFAERMPAEAHMKVEALAKRFPEIHQRAIFFLHSFIPPSAWTQLW